MAIWSFWVDIPDRPFCYQFIHVTPLSQVDSSAPAESSAAQAAAVALQSVTADPKAKGGVSLGEEGELEKEAAKLERPPMDIFKAVRRCLLLWLFSLSFNY